jgi:hypothetical protein
VGGDAESKRGERGNKEGLGLGFIGRGEAVGVCKYATKFRGCGSVAIKATSAAAVTGGEGSGGSDSARGRRKGAGH